MLKAINKYRRSIMGALTRYVGKTHTGHVPDLKGADVRHILVCRPNHRLGNMLLITPLVTELLRLYPNSRIDIFVKGPLARDIFRNYPNITVLALPRKHFRELFTYVSIWFRLRKYRYDLVVNAIPYSSSGRLATRFSRGRNKYYGDPAQQAAGRHNDGLHVAKSPVYGLREYLWKTAGAIPLMDLRLSASELQSGSVILDKLAGRGAKTICIFTYATGSKCYTPAFWDTLYTMLQQHFHDYAIIEVLPVEGISMIGFRAPEYYSRDIREIGSVIANSALFIGADSGMMHLASAVQVPVIGLFSASDPARYGPYGNGSIAIDTNASAMEDCIAAARTLLEARHLGIHQE